MPRYVEQLNINTLHDRIAWLLNLRRKLRTVQRQLRPLALNMSDNKNTFNLLG